jgi:hypothetical protein
VKTSVDIRRFSRAERKVLRQCVIAATDGPFFDDRDFASLFSQDRTAVRVAAEELEHATMLTSSARSAISGSLNNLLRYPHEMPQALECWICLSRKDLETLADRWFSCLPKIAYTSLKVYGPIRHGEHFYRVVEYTTSKIPGLGGLTCQRWNGHNWISGINGPGCPKIMRSPPASIDELLAAGVDTSNLPDGYDPLNVPDA